MRSSVFLEPAYVKIFPKQRNGNGRLVGELIVTGAHTHHPSIDNTLILIRAPVTDRPLIFVLQKEASGRFHETANVT